MTSTTVAPEIKLQNTSTMVNVFTDETKFKYLLYADDFYFQKFYDWVRDSNNKPNDNEKKSAAAYSSYVLKLQCELAQQYNACGFKSSGMVAIMIFSDTANGEFVSAVKESKTVVSNTYSMTKDQNTA